MYLLTGSYYDYKKYLLYYVVYFRLSTYKSKPLTFRLYS